MASVHDLQSIKTIHEMLESIPDDPTTVPMGADLEPIGPGETILGTVSPIMRKLFLAAGEFARLAKSHSLEAESHLIPATDKSQASMRFRHCVRLAEICRELAWTETTNWVEATSGIPCDDCSFHLRENWVVTVERPQEGPDDDESPTNEELNTVSSSVIESLMNGDDTLPESVSFVKNVRGGVMIGLSPSAVKAHFERIKRQREQIELSGRKPN